MDGERVVATDGMGSCNVHSCPEGLLGYPRPLACLYPEGNLTLTGEGTLVIFWGFGMLHMEPGLEIDESDGRSVYKDDDRVGTIVRPQDEHGCVLIQTSVLLDLMMAAELPNHFTA